MDKKVCPPSIIGYKEKVMECIEKKCMFWNEQSKPQICEFKLWLQWSTHLKHLKAKELGEDITKPTPPPPDKAIA